MEHCPEEDIPWILDEIFQHAKKFVYVNIACYPAQKTLPDGQNAHCTIKPKEWWEAIFENLKSKYALEYVVLFDEAPEMPKFNRVGFLKRLIRKLKSVSC